MTLPQQEQILPLPLAARELVVVVHGLPVGQGSKVKLAHGAMVDDNAKRLRPWRASVSHAAQEAMRARGVDTLPLFGRGTPVGIGMVFTFPRPGSHFGTGRNATVLKPSAPMRHIGAPDVDKAQRAVFDALTDAGVWHDDRQAVRVEEAERVYPGGHADALMIPGAVIRLRVLS